MDDSKHGWTIRMREQTALELGLVRSLGVLTADQASAFQRQNEFFGKGVYMDQLVSLYRRKVHTLLMMALFPRDEDQFELLLVAPLGSVTVTSTTTYKDGVHYSDEVSWE